jgi:hypothetical protein
MLKLVLVVVSCILFLSMSPQLFFSLLFISAYRIQAIVYHYHLSLSINTTILDLTIL